jgi:hypothetical protein
LFSLPEDLFLLAINSDKGSVHPSIAHNLKLGLAGAVLLQLALDDCLGLNAQGRLVTLRLDILEHTYLAGLLEKIYVEDRHRKPSYWVDAFSYHQKIVRKLILDNLVARNLVLIEQKRLVFAISSCEGREGKASDKYWLKLTLRNLVLAETLPTSSSIALLKIARAVKLLDLVFTRDERRAAGKFIDDFDISEIIPTQNFPTFLSILDALADSAKNSD